MSGIKDELLEGIRSVYPDSVYKIGESRATSDQNRLSTQCVALDIILDGGIVRGKTVELYGLESSGKTTVALHMVADVQRRGGRAAYVDMEHAIDPYWVDKCGVNINDLILAQPDNGEQALDIVEFLVAPSVAADKHKVKEVKDLSGVDIVIVDSVAALVPQKELEGTHDKDTIGLQARLMGKHMRKMTSLISKRKAVVVYINQLRDKIGVTFGDKTTTPGGKALKFFASIRLQVDRQSYIYEGEGNDKKKVGIKTSVFVKKSKISTPYVSAKFDIRNSGIDLIGSMVEVAEKEGVVGKSGAIYSYGGEKYKGSRKLVEYLEENESEAKDIRKAIFDKKELVDSYVLPLSDAAPESTKPKRKKRKKKV